MVFIGVEGHIPTLVSRIIAFIIIIIMLRNQNLTIHMSKKFSAKLELSMVKRILSIGIPNGVENSLFQLGKILLLSFISGLGTVSVAANAVGNKVSLFQIMPGVAIGYAVVTVVSHCVGAERYDQVKYYTRKLIKLAYKLIILMNIAILLALPIIIKAYGLSEETASITYTIIIMHGVTAMIIWPISFTLPNTLRAANDARYTMIVSVATMWIIRIGFGILIGSVFGIGVIGVWIAMLIDWFVRSAFFVYRYKSDKWMRVKII